MSMRSNSKRNALAEKLWRVVEEAVAAGVTVDDFRDEVRDCWVMAYRGAAEQAVVDLEKARR